MVTPMTSSTTNSPEVVDLLLEKARKIEDTRNFLIKVACDIARGKVVWTGDGGGMINHEFRELSAYLLRSEIEVIDLFPKGG